jgi:hypothetical protein
MLRSESCVGTHLLAMFSNTQRGWGQSVLTRELHTKKGVMGLSLDGSLDDMHHRPEDCLRIGTRLNDVKASHPVVRTQEALAQHCLENGIDDQLQIM